MYRKSFVSWFRLRYPELSLSGNSWQPFGSIEKVSGLLNLHEPFLVKKLDFSHAEYLLHHANFRKLLG